MVRSLKLVVDGGVIGEIRQGETHDFEVPDDARVIWGEMDWAKTDFLHLDNYTESELIVFKGYFSFNFFKTLGMTTMPFKVYVSST